jgi:hypothetical protein
MVGIKQAKWLPFFLIGLTSAVFLLADTDHDRVFF